jgi:hypothetical protein
MRMVISSAGIVTGIENGIEEHKRIGKMKVWKFMEVGAIRVMSTPWPIPRLVIVVGGCWRPYLFSRRRPDSMKIIGLTLSFVL